MATPIYHTESPVVERWEHEVCISEAWTSRRMLDTLLPLSEIVEYRPPREMSRNARIMTGLTNLSDAQVDQALAGDQPSDLEKGGGNMTEANTSRDEAPGPFPAEIFRTILKDGAMKLSDNAMEPYVRDKIKAFEGSDAELYDLMVWIHELPFERIPGMNASVGDVNAFLHTLCDVKKYYVRPD